MKKEFKLMLSVLQKKEIKEESEDWYYLLGLLQLNRVAPSFYFNAKEIGYCLPKQIEKNIEREIRQTAYRNTVIKSWIEDIQYELTVHSANAAFLKGSILSHCIIGDKVLYKNGERISNDIDLLVSPSGIENADAALKELGFVQGEWNEAEYRIVPFSRKEIIFRRMSRGETAPYLIELNDELVPFVEVDLNYSLTSSPNADKELVEKFLEHRQKYCTESKKELVSLTIEYFLLHLILHQYKEATMQWMVCRNKDSQLYKYYDIYLLLKSDKIDFNLLLAAIKEGKAEKECYYVLYYCGKLFDDLKIGELLAQLKPDETDYLNEFVDSEKHAKYKWIVGIEKRIEDYERKNYYTKM